MADIFLSYAREDRPWASRLALGLIEHGWSLFWDSDIPIGKTFDHVIENQLDAAGCIVVLWSRHSVSSNWVKAEASEGARRGILHPVLIENVKLPLEFRRLQTANLIDWQRGMSHGEFDQLIGGIAATLRSSRGLDVRLQEARAAFGRGDCARCLEILREIADAAEGAGLGDEVAELRRTAEAEQDKASREELRRQRARAEEQRAAIGASRSQAQADDGDTWASALWLAAEAKKGEVEAACDDASLRAAVDREEAKALHGQAGDAARAAASREEVERQRHAAEQARERMSRAHESAQSTDARERAPTLWIDAERRATEGQYALAEDDPVRAVKAFEEAAASYHEAEEAAREHMRREEIQRRAQAHQARDTARERRNAARVLHAARRAPNHWEGGESKLREAESALAGGDYGEAQRLFDETARIYESAERAARDVLLRERQGADASRARMAAAREAARVAVATQRAGPLWSAAEASVAAAEAAYEREQYDGATEGFEKAADLFQQCGQAALDQVRAEREGAERARAAMTRRREAAQASAPHYAPATWAEAEAKAADGESAFQGGDYAGAEGMFEQASDLYRRAEGAVREGLHQEELRRQHDDARAADDLMKTARAAALDADAPRRAAESWQRAESAAAEGPAAFTSKQYQEAAHILTEATALYRQAETGARAAVRADETRRQREAAEYARERFAQSRMAAVELDAPACAPDVWRAGETRSAEGAEAFTRAQYADAAGAFTEASTLYGKAVEAAREALRQEELRRQREDAQEASRVMGRRRAVVLRLDLEEDAAAPWNAAEALAAEGQGLFAQEKYPEAAEMFARAATLYEQAGEVAREALQSAGAKAPPAAPEESPASVDPALGGASPPARGVPAVEALPPDLAETTVFDEAEGREPAPPPALPTEWPKARPIWRLGGAWLVACVGGIAVVLSAVGISWYRSTQEETPKIVRPLPSPAPQPPESSPSPPHPSPQAPGLPPAPNREREVVEDLSKKVAAAREQATKASAERLAAAATEAQNVLARKQDEIGRLQRQVEVSRRTAAGAQAEKRAGPQWTKATRLYQAAQAAVAQGDHDKAGELFKEATAGFDNAAKAAEAEFPRRAKLKEDVKGEQVREPVVGPSGAGADAEQARLRMAAAKRAAEQVAAGFFANKRFTSAQSKERDGIAALGQSDYRAAIGLFVEAQSEYQAAVQEARQEAERDRQLAPLKASLEQAHAAAAARRQQALAAEADDLARGVFDQAQARQVEADGLAKRQELAAAAQAYRDAAERYGEATLRARAVRAGK